MSVRHFTKIWDLDKEEFLFLINRAMYFKKEKKWDKNLKGKVLALIFEKASTRTRISFEVAMHKLGGTSLFFISKGLAIVQRGTY